MALSKRLQVLDDHLRRQNDRMRDVFRRGEGTPRGFAPTAPLPADPTRCRWCDGQLRALYDDGPVDYCQNGCARNDVAPYLADCTGCGQAFHTGERMATTCYPCKSAEQGARTPLPETPRADWVERNERRRAQRQDG